MSEEKIGLSLTTDKNRKLIVENLHDYNIDFLITGCNKFFSLSGTEIIALYICLKNNYTVMRLPFSRASEPERYYAAFLKSKFNLKDDCLYVTDTLLFGHPDFIVYNENEYFFLEVKFGKDKKNKNQIEWETRTGSIMEVGRIKDEVLEAN